MLEPENQGRDGEDLEAQPGPGCAQHGQPLKAPQLEAKKVRAELAKRIRNERSEGQARIMVSRVVFGSFF